MIIILALLEIPVLNHSPILLAIENGLNMKKASLEICCKFLLLSELLVNKDGQQEGTYYCKRCWLVKE